MEHRNATYKERTRGFADLERRRTNRALEESRNRRTRRSAIRDTRRKIVPISSPGSGINNPNTPQNGRNISKTKTPQNAEREAEQNVENSSRRAMLEKWQARRAMEKEMKKRNQVPAFRAGVYRHKLDSPIFLHQTFTNVKPAKPPSPRITRATAKRIAAKMNSTTQTNSSLVPKNHTKNVISKNSTKENMIPKSFAPDNHQFKAPSGLSSVHLFGKEALKEVYTKRESLPVYFSPYVVSARGKKASRQEQLINIEIAAEIENAMKEKKKSADELDQEKLVDKHDDEGELTPAYFKSITRKEVTRLRGVCQEWYERKTGSDIPENAQDVIDQAIGQTNLLIEKKIEQFKGLISNCEDGTGEKLVTLQDLQGFWDMIYLQVENCNLRFAKLQELQQRNWEEEESKSETVKRVEVRKKPAAAKKEISSKSSSVRDIIRAARRQRMMELQRSSDIPVGIVNEPSNNVTSLESLRPSTVKFDGGFFEIESPMKAVTPRSAQKLTSQKLEFSTEPKHRLSAMRSIRVSQKLKSLEIKPLEVENDPSIRYINSQQTPGRSILKQSHPNDCSIFKHDAGTSHIKKQLNFEDDLSDAETDIAEPNLEDANRENPNCGAPEIGETDPRTLSPPENKSEPIATTTRKSLRRMLSEQNETVTQASCIPVQEYSPLTCHGKFVDSEHTKENQEPKRRRSTRKSVKFTGAECTACEVKVYPMTPRSKRRSSRTTPKDKEDLISSDTPQEPLPRVRRSLRLHQTKQQ